MLSDTWLWPDPPQWVCTYAINPDTHNLLIDVEDGYTVGHDELETLADLFDTSAIFATHRHAALYGAITDRASIEVAKITRWPGL